MKLSKIERWMLSNQYQILEKLDPEQAKHYANAREVIENGYTLEYEWISQYIMDEFPVEGCTEVLDILDMFQSLKFSYDELDDKSGIKEASVRFQGFDGNHETNHMAYARHLVEDEGKFDVLQIKNFNGHFPSLDRYLWMVEEWNKSADKFRLTKDDIIRITSAK